jgi:fucose permease
MRRLGFNHTIYASYVAYTVQALVNNFTPLLFVTFSLTYGISLEKIGLIVSINFIFQLIVDFIAAKLLDKVGYRASMICAHLSSFLGFALLSFLPEMIEPYTAIIISTLFTALGGGLIEVTVSPVVEATPTTNAKEAAMSLLHSFYCWGQLFTILISTLFFAVFGIENWRILAFLWGIIPLLNSFYCMLVPINSLTEKGKALSVKKLFSNKAFLLFLFIMICAGATELTVAQWASALYEKSGIPKAIGDLLGPCVFALFMGIVRAGYAKFSTKIKIENALMLSGIIGVVGYLLIALSPFASLSLLGCGLCGVASALLWPGTLSLSAKTVVGGGTAMFAFLALGGDLGCSVGPGFAGWISDFFGENLQIGILSGIIFPVGIIAGALIAKKINQ